MTSLLKLPTEMQWMIFANMSSPQDLYSYIRVSRVIYRSFAADPNKFLSLMLKNSIQAVAQPWALALSCIPVTHSLASASEAHAFLVDLFIKGKYADGMSSTDRASLVTLARQHQRLNYFIQHFVRTAFDPTSIWASATDPGDEEELMRNRRGNVTENDRKSGTLPYWAALNHEHKQECRSAELQAVSDLTNTEVGRLQRAFYIYELYCRLVQPTDGTDVAGSLLSARQQYEWILAYIPTFQIEEMLSVQQYYISIAGKLFDQVENELVNEVSSLRRAVFHPIPLTETRLHVALQQAQSQPNLKELQYRLAEMEESLNDPRCTPLKKWPDPDRTYFLSSTTALVCHKPSDLVRLASLRPSFILGPYCNQIWSRGGGGEARRNEAIYLSSRGAAYIEKVLCSSNSDRLELLRENLENKRQFLLEAVGTHLRRHASGSSDAHETADRPIGDDLDYPNFGWYACRHPAVPTFSLDRVFSPYREVGHVFWDTRRMVKEPIRDRLMEINENVLTLMEKAVYWPRSKERASWRLQSIWIKSEDMEVIIRKYRSTARTSVQ